jgi:hypothetical protein
MKKVNWQYLIDLLLFISIVGVVAVGFLLGFVLPKGPTASESAKYFLGLHRHAWGDIHLYLGIAFTVLTVIHLILGWSWIKGKTRAFFGSRWKGAIVAICLLPLVVLAGTWLGFPDDPAAYDHNVGTAAGRNLQAHENGGHVSVAEVPPARPESNTPTEKPQHDSHHGESKEVGLTCGRASADASGILITGQMTLRDIEEETGIPSLVLADQLGIPSTESPDSRLGRLRKRYGFTMQEVRSAISSLLESQKAL